jgi:curli production assembly/transport component CsgG
VLILEGIKDSLWTTEEGPDKNKELVDQYLLEQELESSTALYEREFLKHDYRHTASAAFGVAYVDGDFSSGIIDYNAELGYKYRFLPGLSLGTSAQIFRLNSTQETSHWWISETAYIEYNMLPHDKLSPFFYGGPGILLFVDNDPAVYLQKMDTFFQLKFGAGLEYAVSDRVSFIANGAWNATFSDKIDNQVSGRRDDFYFTFAAGINYHFGSKKSKLKINQ